MGDPVAVHTGLGEDQQQLVAGANGLPDLLVELLASLHVLWGEPDAELGSLDLGHQLLGKGFVVIAVAEETGEGRSRRRLVWRGGRGCGAGRRWRPIVGLIRYRSTSVVQAGRVLRYGGSLLCDQIGDLQTHVSLPAGETGL